MPMTFEQYWDSDEAFRYRHEDEREQAKAAWNVALAEAAALVRKRGAYGDEGLADQLLDLRA